LEGQSLEDSDIVMKVVKEALLLKDLANELKVQKYIVTVVALTALYNYPRTKSTLKKLSTFMVWNIS